METDEGVISDKSKLPILGVSYGHFAFGSAEIMIGPLTCSSGESFTLIIVPWNVFFKSVNICFSDLNFDRALEKFPKLSKIIWTEKIDSE